MKKLIYWSPCLGNVGTIKSTLNSATSCKTYHKDKYNVIIINVCGEWNSYKEYLKKNDVELVDLTFDYYRFLPKEGFLKSRFSYTLIFIISLFPLIKFLIKEKQSIFIAHLITSLPIFLSFFFKKKIDFVLRISGFPKLHFLRRFFWKVFFNNLKAVTCPTIELKEYLSKIKFLDEKKLHFLPDAIIKINIFNNNIKEKINLPTNNKFILAVGRLTKQKNYLYMIDELELFLKNNNYSLIILGEGEDRTIIEKKIIEKKLTNKIFLCGYVKNPYPYMKKASALVLSSLWEEVGFVLVESALSNLLLISSNCKNGPKEFLSQGKAGYLFNSKVKNQLKDSINFIHSDNYKKKVLAKKNSLQYTDFRHSLIFNKIIKILND